MKAPSIMEVLVVISCLWDSKFCEFFEICNFCRISLYPKQFKRSYHLPSFDVNDLHTVDQMILGKFHFLEIPFLILYFHRFWTNIDFR